MYSKLTTDVNSFRLERISEIKDEIIKERDKRHELCKKYKNMARATDVLDSSFIMLSIACAGGGAATAVVLPAGIALESCAGALGFLALICKFTSRKLHSKIKKNEAIRILADTKLNTMSDLISKALDDNEISDEDFEMILNELTNFYDTKKELKSSREEMDSFRAFKARMKPK